MAGLNSDSLFSLELVVDKLTLPKVQCRYPAIAFRLLDFPTLIIYHVEPELGDSIKFKIRSDPLYRLGPQIPELLDKDGSFSVQKGKSCLMKIAPNLLLSHLCSTPLYVMVIDSFPETPKLIGNSTVPLDSTMNRLYEDICKLGLAVPAVQGEKGYYKIYNLMGNEIGGIVLGIRILSLGVGLIPHLPVKATSRNVKKEDEHALPTKRERNIIQKQVADIVLQDFESTKIELDNARRDVNDASSTTQIQLQPPTRVQMPTQTEREVLQNIATQTNKKQRQKRKKATLDIASQINGNLVDDIVVTNTVCPPPLYFNCDKEPKHGKNIELLTNILHGDKKTDGVQSDFSDEDTIREEDTSVNDEFDVESTAVETFKVNKSKEKPFLPPSTINGLVPNFKDFPLLNAIMTEIVTISGTTTQKPKAVDISIAKPRRSASLSPKRGQKLERSPSPSRRRSPSPRRERESVENFVKRMHSPKHTIRELPVVKPTYDTTHAPIPRKPTHSHKCGHGQPTVPKCKSWIRHTPVPLEVTKTKLSYGLTNTQRLRLEKSNPSLLKSLEIREAERVQRFKEQRRLEEQTKERVYGRRKKLYDGTVPRGPILSDKSHKKPVPTPRHTIYSTQESVFDQQHPLTTIQQVHEQYRHQYNATPDIDVVAEKADCKECGDNQQEMEEHINTDAKIPQGSASREAFGKTKVLHNDPGFPVSETGDTQGDYNSYADDFDDPTEKSESRHISSVRDVPQRSYYGYDKRTSKPAASPTDNIQVTALDPTEVLGLKQMNEVYSEDDDQSQDSFKSAMSQSDHVEVKPYPVTSDSGAGITDTKRFTPPSPSTYQPSPGASGVRNARFVDKSKVPVDASVESTAYISRSQVFANQSQDSEVSVADINAPESSRQVAHRIRRNTDSVSSYIGEDDVSPISNMQNYSDESFNNESDDNLSEYAVPDPLSMKDIQISKEAKLGYTWA